MAEEDDGLSPLPVSAEHPEGSALLEAGLIAEAEAAGDIPREVRSEEVWAWVWQALADDSRRGGLWSASAPNYPGLRVVHRGRVIGSDGDISAMDLTLSNGDTFRVSVARL